MPPSIDGITRNHPARSATSMKTAPDKEQHYVTYKHALSMLGALVLSFGAFLAWADSHFIDEASMKGTKEDITIIKECIINGKCKPTPP